MSTHLRRCVNEDCCVADSLQIEQGRIGVVTVTYNSEQVLQEFLDSLTVQTYRNFVLYLVDNASKDKTLEMLGQRTDMAVVIIANVTNLGVAEGNNQGIRAALADGCECVLLLNNDTVLQDDLIAELYDGLVRYPCDMTTGKMYYHDRPDVFWCAGARFQPWRAFKAIHEGRGQRDTGQYDQPRRITYTPTCCLLVRRTVFDRIGMMDGQYFAYYDDADFLVRSLLHEIPLWYVPEAKLWHKVASLASRQPEFVIRLFARNRVYFIRKYVPRRLAHLWYWLDQCRYALAFVLLRSSFAKWRLRRTSAQEGWAMYLP
jgi:GT2 family glycosyltransferase